MKDDKKERYEAPLLTVAAFRVEQGFTTSNSLFRLSLAWLDSGTSAWDGSGTTGSNTFGGWTDNGGSAWD